METKGMATSSLRKLADMSLEQPSNRPVMKWRNGNFQLAIWKNLDKFGKVRYNATLEKSTYDQETKTRKSLGKIPIYDNEAEALERLMEQFPTFLFEKRQKGQEENVEASI